MYVIYDVQYPFFWLTLYNLIPSGSRKWSNKQTFLFPPASATPLAPDKFQMTVYMISTIVQTTQLYSGPVILAPEYQDIRHINHIIMSNRLASHIHLFNESFLLSLILVHITSAISHQLNVKSPLYQTRLITLSSVALTAAISSRPADYSPPCANQRPSSWRTV